MSSSEPTPGQPTGSPPSDGLPAVPRQLTAHEIEAWRPSINPWVIALTVTLATFMEVLDTSIANVALPHIAGNLSSGLDEATWVLTSYLVSNAIILPLNGWFSAVLGRKRYYMISVGIFTVSSALCGFATNLGMLVFFRILQGIGGGGLQPTEQAILADTFPREKRSMGMAIYGVAVVTAPIIGPTLGGWITDNFTWRWIFFINIPVGIVSLTLTSRLVQDPPFLKRVKWGQMKVDTIGLGLIAVGLGFMQVVLDKGQTEDWFASQFITVLSVLAVAALVGAIFWELRVKEPVIELRLLRNRNFFISNILMFMLGFVLYGSTALLPLFMQNMLGYTAMQSGMALSPGGFISMMLFPIVGALVMRVQARWVVMIGIAGVAGALIYMSHFTLGISFHMAVLARCIQAFGLAFLFVPINQMAFHFIPRQKNNAASGLINLARNLGGSCGIAFAVTLLSRRAQFHQNVLSSQMSVYNPNFQTALAGAKQMMLAHGSDPARASQQAYAMLGNSLTRQATFLSYLDDFRVMAFFFLAMIPLLFMMKKTKPHKDGMVVH